ncbi:TetR/AcrR family transcriptional regulator [Dyadobacter frigoris]|uniref:TetR/AcrR family transcriptional regulator n=1 Tax=Dyadobacter frigoris TaxID=2576211 RepID=A0A4U6CV94_9BACT|nr:TetR/AcrR family transcriptional regulator [Dyadobacter frigoris]TKT87008.1 TetR/AcrR family transcriptional regulator [Dyadobacter frigoris]GLU52795.1 hypothetical protein Dfri01_22560 [Dyadobacter frigoris]
MYNTKIKILNASVRLFNENGIDSVRLQQIADESEMSVGNLAYHYKSKDVLIEAVYERVFDEFNEIFRHYLKRPDLADFDIQISIYYTFFSRNRFYLSEFFKANNSTAPHYLQWQDCTAKMLLQLRSRLQFMVRKNELLPEKEPGQYELLAEQIWMSLVFFIPKSNMIGQHYDEISYKKNIWNLLRPYFGPDGLEEFRALIVPVLF